MPVWRWARHCWNCPIFPRDDHLCLARNTLASRTMKIIFSTACLVSALLMFASCGSTKKSPSAPTGVQEFDAAAGTWKPATKIVAPPPHPTSAPLPKVVEESEHTPMWKKPLKWVGLDKDKPAPPPPVPAKSAAKPKDNGPPDASVVNQPPARSPIEPKPGHESLWKRIGDTLKKPFHWGSSSDSGATKSS